MIDPVARIDQDPYGKRGNRAWLDHDGGGMVVTQ